MPGFTDEQKTELSTIVKEMITPIVVETTAPLKDELMKMVNGATTKALKPLKERLEALPSDEAMAEKIRAQADEIVKAMTAAGGEAANRQGGTAGAGAESEAVKELRKALEISTKKVETLVTDLQKEKIEKSEMAAVQLKKEERNQLAIALEKAQVNVDFRPAVLAMLIERGAVKRDEEHNVCFEYKDHARAETRLLPIEEGVLKWVETDEGKAYLPPKKTGGSGEGGTGKGARAATGTGIRNPAAFVAAFNRNEE